MLDDSAWYGNESASFPSANFPFKNCRSSSLRGTRIISPEILGTTVKFIGIILSSFKNKIRLPCLQSMLFILLKPKVTTDSFSVPSKVNLSTLANLSKMHDLWDPKSNTRRTDAEELCFLFLSHVCCLPS